MQKLRLDVDTLRVQSFKVTADAAGPRGSVHAHDSYETFYCTDPSSVGPNYCRPYPWSWNSCPSPE